MPSARRSPPARHARARPILLTAIILVLIACCLDQPAGAAPVFQHWSRPATAGRLLPLAGSLPPAITSARRLGAFDPRRSITLAISLRLRHSAVLRALLHVLYDPHSPLYHQFLTTRQFAARFAPTAADVQPLLSWLRAAGLQIEQRDRNGLLITVRGSAAQVAAAFHTSIGRYAGRGTMYPANDRPLELPASVLNLVASVSGLSAPVRMHPSSPLSRPHLQPATPFTGYTPHDIARLYDLTPLQARGLDGGGQTIALFEMGDFDEADLGIYAAQFGITPGPLQRIPVSDGQSSGAPRGGKGQIEAELNIEVVQGIAPRASVLVYEAPNTTNGGIALWNRIVSDDRATTISSSWGVPETSVTPGEQAAIHAALLEAAAQGQTVLANTGDNGAFAAAALGATNPQLQHQLAVDFPASDPWVTAVGGTTLVAGPDGGYNLETAWSDHSTTPPEGGGGGLSALYPCPDYQTGPGVQNAASNGMRQLPDVAADADPRSGYALYVSGQFIGGGSGWLVDGGTSGATPLWAALVALYDEQHGAPLGFLNPALYALARQSAGTIRPPFHDITQGDNLYYSAKPGWDFATGWGSPDAEVLGQALAPAPPPPTPTITPTPRPTDTPTITPTPTETPSPTATPLPTETPTLTALPTPAPTEVIPISVRLVRKIVHSGQRETVVVHSIDSSVLHLLVIYPRGARRDEDGITDASGRWRYSWRVRSGHKGKAHVIVLVLRGQSSHLADASFHIR